MSKFNSNLVLILALTGTFIWNAGYGQRIDSMTNKQSMDKKMQEEYRLRNDWADLERFKIANAELPAPVPGENRVIFMGNSITQGWIDMVPEFFKGKAFINRGIGGQTTPQMLVRFRPDVVDLKPRVVVILAGTNDIAGNTGPVSLDNIIGNIKSMAELAKVNGVAVVISSILPVYDYPWKKGLNPVEKIALINSKLRVYAQEHGMVYLDYYASMADENKGLRKELTYDGVHPNRAGYAVMQPLAEQAIRAALAIGRKRQFK